MGKVSKESVGYRPATGHRRCGNCSMFRLQVKGAGLGECTLVRGLIREGDTCDRWAAEADRGTLGRVPL